MMFSYAIHVDHTFCGSIGVITHAGCLGEHKKSLYIPSCKRSVIYKLFTSSPNIPFKPLLQFTTKFSFVVNWLKLITWYDLVRALSNQQSVSVENYHLIVVPWKFDVLKTNICLRSEASRANICFENIKFLQGHYQSIVPRQKHSIVYIESVVCCLNYMIIQKLRDFPIGVAAQ